MIKASVERAMLPGPSKLLVQFEIDEYHFQQWKFNRYGNSNRLNMNTVDPVGEALHLLREYYLDWRNFPAVEKVKVELVDDTTPLLPPVN
jgi:hypothetical protein